MTHAEDAKLLREAITASGMSARRFAVDALARDERTVRKWLAGEFGKDGLPEVVRVKLRRTIAAAGTKRRRTTPAGTRRVAS